MSRGKLFALVAVLCALAMTVAMIAGCGCGKKEEPTISSISPAKGEVGDEVTLIGTAFGDTEGDSTVEFGTVTADVESWSDTGIQTLVPKELKAGEYVVSVTTKDGTSNKVDYDVTEKKAEETDRKQGQIEHDTPVQAILDYCKKNDIDTTGMTFSVAKASSIDPDWKIDVGYVGGRAGTDVLFLLNEVKGKWIVIAHRGEAWTADELKELGAPTDLVLEPEPTPAPNAQTQAIGNYLESKGQSTTGWTFSVYRVSIEDPNWEMIQGIVTTGEQGEKFLLVWNNMAGAWEVLAMGDPPWTGVEFKGEPVPSDLNKE